MTSCAELLANTQPETHFVQLYGKDDRLLTTNVSRYLSEGLRRGEGLIVIATAEHRSSIARQLREEIGYSKAVLEGRLVFLDARDTLSRLLRDGLPDKDLFRSVVGAAVSGVRDRAGHAVVRAYGEMVGLLWVEGNLSAAEQLEGYWNSLLDASEISLFCAYPIDVFGEEFQMDAVDAVLCSHTHLLPLDGALDSALSRAMNEVLGDNVEDIRTLMQANHRPSWGIIPRGESIILWLRNNLPARAQEILNLARQYYRSEAVALH
jgi:hypothetical protein